MLVKIRFSVSELMEGGMSIDESVATIDSLSHLVDVVQCSAGKVHNPITSSYVFPMPYMPHGVNAYLAGEVKARVGDKVVVEAIGGINEPEMADRLVADGSCDLVGMARSFIADPNWGEKAKDGRAEDIRPCIRCLRCLNYATPPQTGTSVCTVNPRRVIPHELPKSEPDGVIERSKKVLVVGGGPAGMLAAYELAHKGHKVTLAEKSGSLGGRLSFADHVVFKEDIKRYRRYLETQVGKRENIQVLLDTEATAELVEREQPDAIVVAVGAKPFYPDIPGVNGPNVVHACDAYGNEDKLGEKLVVVGGGFVGCEMVVHLQTRGKRIDVIEMRDRLMADADAIKEERFLTEYYMTHAFDMNNRSLYAEEIDRVRIHLEASCVEITEKGVWMEKDGQKTFLEADTVIMATGFRPDEKVAKSFEGLARDVVEIGDCVSVSDLLNTSSGGYAAAMQI